MKVEEALQIKNSDIASYLKLPPVKLHCSMLAEEAIKKAIEDVKAKNGQIEQWIDLIVKYALWPLFSSL